jgi:hypothetical protein
MNNLGAFLSPYISSSIAIKAISKMNPKMKEFVNRAMTWGYGADEIMQFLRQNVTGGPGQYEKMLASQDESTLPPEKLLQAQQFSRNRERMSSIPKIAGAAAGTLMGAPYAPVVETIASMLPGQEEKSSTSQETQPPEASGIGHDELHGLIMQHLNQGRNPLEAGALVAQMADTKQYGHLKKPIKALEKKHNMKFPDIVAKLYQMAMGKQAMPQQQQPQQQQPPAMPQQAQGGAPRGVQIPQPGTPEFGEFAKEFMRLKKNMGMTR